MLKTITSLIFLILLITGCTKESFDNNIPTGWNITYELSISGTIKTYCTGVPDTTLEESTPLESNGKIIFNADSTGTANPFFGINEEVDFIWGFENDDLILSIPYDGYSVDTHLRFIKNEGYNKKIYKVQLFGIEGGCYVDYTDAEYIITLTKQ